MDRRRFCKIGMMALGAVGLGRFSSLAADGKLGPDEMFSEKVSRPFRLTVIRRECYDDLQSMYLDDPESGPCEFFEVGESWDFEVGGVCPEGFCRRAWSAVASVVNNTAMCALPRAGHILVSCPDGSRPVIFRVSLKEL